MLTAWFLVISGMTTLLVAANRKKQMHACKEILITIKGSGEKYYIERADVLSLIGKTTSGSLVQKPVTAIDLRKMEKALESNAWISEAELYFDSKDALHVIVEEREPIARVFTSGGSSFYLDSAGKRMPLLDKMSARLPVVTGFINAKRLNARDSVLLQEVKKVALFIYTHPFWNAQIGQIDITTDRKFELIPVIGDHIIRIGTADRIEEKLERLYVFYKQVMRRAGFNKYAALDLQYDGQVVGVKKGIASAIDSIQLQKNIEELMNRATLENIDDEMLPAQNSVSIKTDSTVSKTVTQNNSVAVKTNPSPANLKTISNPARTKIYPNPTEKSKHVKKKAKAVMKRQ